MAYRVEVEIPDGVTHAYIYVQSARDLRLHGFTLVHIQQGIKLWKKDIGAHASLLPGKFGPELFLPRKR